MAIRVAVNLAAAADRFRGGTGTFVDGLLDSLASLGSAIDVVIVASPAASALGVWRRPGTSWRHEVFMEEAARSFGFAALGDDGAVAALVRRLKIDVWLTPHTLPAPPVPPCATVGAILDVQHEDLSELYAPRERARRALVYETIARTSTRVITLSAFSRDRIAARYRVDPRRLDVVPLAPPAWTRQPRTGHATAVPRPYVLYPATTWRHKNHVTLIDALACVRTSGTDVGLVLTGLEGEAHPEVVERVAAHRLAPYVTWHGHVDEDRLRALYDGAAVVAVPSRYEGFGLPVLEAMARGVPVVASTAASLPEVAGEAAMLVPPLDAGAWAEALSGILTDERLAGRLRAAGALRAQAFAPAHAAARLRDSLLQAAADGPAASMSPRHCGPDRSFAGCCRYFLQAPTAGTLEVRGSAGEAEGWTMTFEATANGEPAAPHVRDGEGAFEATWTIPAAPASVRVAIEAAGPATLEALILRLVDGTVLDLLPSIDGGGPEETLDESLARAVVRLHALAAARGLRRLALYGAGSHSRLLIARLAGGPCTVAGVIDDAPKADRFENLPLVPPARWASLDADALVLSSRGAEPQLAARAAAWLPAGVPLVRLHT
jgi:glycosyltransferase involved in cell wall biosynthesis